jgi:hypothetical protein
VIAPSAEILAASLFKKLPLKKDDNHFKNLLPEAKIDVINTKPFCLKPKVDVINTKP